MSAPAFGCIGWNWRSYHPKNFRAFATILSLTLAFKASFNKGDSFVRRRAAVMADETVCGVSINRFGNNVCS